MNRTNRGKLCFIFSVMIFMLALTSSVSGEPLEAFETGQLVVKINEGVDLSGLNSTYGTTTLKPLLNSSQIFLLEAPGNLEQLAAQMAADDRVQYTDLNVIGQAPEATAGEIYAWPGEDADETTLRLYYEWEWAGYDAAHYYNQPAVPAVKLDQTLSSGEGVTVAILDTGLEMTHPVLVNNLAPVQYDFVDNDDWPAESFNNIDDDGDGFVDEVAGHGTHVAGIIHLVAPAAQIMPLRVLNSDGQGNAFVVAEALMFAAAHGADVINLSLGSTLDSVFLHDVIDQITSQGIIIVAAAGNLNSNLAQYPAAFDCTLAVTAVGPGIIKADYASYGDWVDVVAPGERIYSTYPNQGFTWWKGTSMATPFVAGQAALLLGYDPALTPADVGSLIAGTADSVDNPNPDYAGQLGTGEIDIQASLNALAAGSWPVGDDPLAGCGS